MNSIHRAALVLLLILLTGVAASLTLSPSFGYAESFSGWAGGCTSGSNCVSGTSNGFTCTSTTCGSPVAGSGDGQFGLSGNGGPFGVAVDRSGNVYVTDPFNRRVEKFSGSPPVFVGWAGGCTGGTNCVGSGSGGYSNGFTCTAETCSGPNCGACNGDGQFGYPVAVAVDGSGNVYITDQTNERVDEFASDGAFLGWAGGCSGPGTGGASVSNCGPEDNSNGFDCTALTCAGAGGGGSGDGQFSDPYGVAIDGSGNVYVVDYGNARVEEFSGTPPVFAGWAGGCSGPGSSGESASKCDTTIDASMGFTCTAATCSVPLGNVGSSGDGQFYYPAGVAVDSSGNVYIGDGSNNRVEEFSGGAFVGWAGECAGGADCDTSGGADHSNGFTCTASTCTGLTAGSGDGQFDIPYGVAADRSGNVYVSDVENHREVKFSGGLFVGWAGGCGSGTDCNTGIDASMGFTCTATTCSEYARTGSGDGQFQEPNGVAVDGSGNVYVADYGLDYRVDLFSAPTTSTTISSTVLSSTSTTSSATTTFTSKTPVSSTTTTTTEAPLMTNTILTTTTATGYLAGTSTTTFTSPFSTSYSTTSFVASAATSVTQTGTTTTSTVQSATTTSTGTILSTTTSGGAVTVSESDTFNVLLTQIFQELEQFEAFISQTLGFQVTATPVGQQVHEVVVTLIPISLQPGWNLISIPIIPTNPSITAVLKSQIAANEVIAVWSYTGTPRTWEEFIPGKGGTLTTMVDGNGYWIDMTAADTLYVNGAVFANLPTSAPPSYSLLQGWNLVGFKPQPTVQSETIGQYLSSINGEYDPNSVWVYTSTGWVRAGSNYMLQPGQAMWTMMTTPATLQP